MTYENKAKEILEKYTSCYSDVDVIFLAAELEEIRKETAREILHDLNLRINNYAMIAKLEDTNLHFIETKIMKDFVERLEKHYGVGVEEC